MGRFGYIVIDKEKRKIAGSEEAKSAEDLVSVLQDRGFLVLSVFPQEVGEKKRRQRFTHRGISSADLVFFSRQLAVMLGASVPLLRTLDTILKQVSSRNFNTVLSQVRKDVEGGLSLKEALNKHPRVFSELWLGLIEIGEASGNLPAVLDRLATYLEKQVALKKKFVSALIYPIILFIVATGALSVFMFVVIPKFTQIFNEFNVPLPVLTRIVIGISAFLGRRVLWIILSVVGGTVFLRYSLRTARGKQNFDKARLKLPLFGDFFRTVAIEQFALQMSILVESGVPIVYALEIAERAHVNTVLGTALTHIKDGVRQGKSLGKHLEQELIFPELLVQMITIGEETGELSGMLKKVSQFYEEYIDNFVLRLSAMFEPIIIVFMGGLIGTLVIAMFLPIFSIASIGGTGR